MQVNIWQHELGTCLGGTEFQVILNSNYEVDYHTLNFENHGFERSSLLHSITTMITEHCCSFNIDRFNIDRFQCTQTRERCHKILVASIIFYIFSVIRNVAGIKLSLRRHAFMVFKDSSG